MPRIGEVYHCNCSVQCKGVARVVSRSTYNNHAPYRAYDASHSGPQRRTTTSSPSQQPIAMNVDLPQRTTSTLSSSATLHLLPLVQPHLHQPPQQGMPPLEPVDEGSHISKRNQEQMMESDHNNGGGPYPDEPMQEHSTDQDMEQRHIDEQNTDDDDDEDDNNARPVLGAQNRVLGPEEFDTDSDDDMDVIGLTSLAQREDMKIATEFISAIREARLGDRFCKLDEATKDRLNNPPNGAPPPLDDDTELALNLFLATNNAPQETYNATRAAVLKRHPNTEILSYNQVKGKVAELSGVTSVVHDMCVNSCIAFTGPSYGNLDRCPYPDCGELRYDPLFPQKRTPRQVFHTIPVGPQLQALRRHPQLAEDSKYRQVKTADVLAQLDNNPGAPLPEYSDIMDGSDYIEAVRKNHIKQGDMVLMFSIDGAQLYRMKQSECWIYIWVVFDHHPEKRYKKKYVLPGGFIPGPRNPRNVDSFIFPGLHHLSALQTEGFKIWDITTGQHYKSHPYLALATADGPAMAHLNGLVGHSGKLCCRLYCGIVGRRHQQSTHYYPALLRPTAHGEDSHADVNPTNFSRYKANDYRANLDKVVAARTDAAFKRLRKETGISKPSIFQGLQSSHTMPLPYCFGSDIMHLISLNIPDLLLSLWRGTIDCQNGDHKQDWDWAVLQDRAQWEQHGEAVADTKRYLPGSFDRAPRNPAQKLNSGYKAWEFLIYIFGLGPAIFYELLPERYWKHFCKLVAAVRIIYQYRIRQADLAQANRLFLDYALQFEILYCERKSERLHFVRPCVHALIHLAPGVHRTGPLIGSSQWTMERAIGSLGQEIRQPSNPFANLSQRGVLRAQVNALAAIYPDLGPQPKLAPYGSIDLGNGYLLLRARQKKETRPTPQEKNALLKYFQEQGRMAHPPAGWDPRVRRWARVRLANGQVARSLWNESRREARNVRMARNVKIQTGSTVGFGEVQYYFEDNPGGQEQRTALAMISIYSDLDLDLLKQSSETLWSYIYKGNLNLKVIPVQQITAVVAMVPHRISSFDGERHFLVEKPGLDISKYGGDEQDISEDELELD